MSDEPEARMWDDGGSRYEPRSRGAYFESAFASSEHLDRAPLLAEVRDKKASASSEVPGALASILGINVTYHQDAYTEVSVGGASQADVEHCHWVSRAEPPSAVPQLLAALLLCALFMLCELVGGYVAGSLSVMSDAAHMLSDCGGFALALLAFHCAKRQPDTHMSYGYKRAEVLGAMVSVLLIWVLTGVFVYVACVRLRSGEYSVEPDVMLLVSGCGVAFNVVLALVLHGCASDIAHHHTHGGAACAHPAPAPPAPRPRFRLFGRAAHKHANGSLNGDYTMKELAHDDVTVHGSRQRNINLRAALIHVIGDLIQSCGVLLASVIIKFYPSWQFIDPVCTFVFSVVVLATSARVVRDALNMLMQGVPAGFRYVELVSALAGVAGVRHVHSVHAWALSTHHVEVSAHVVIDELSDWEQVLRACRAAARAHGASAATIQPERGGGGGACAACRQPGLPP